MVLIFQLTNEDKLQREHVRSRNGQHSCSFGTRSCYCKPEPTSAHGGTLPQPQPAIHAVVGLCEGRLVTWALGHKLILLLKQAAAGGQHRDVSVPPDRPEQHQPGLRCHTTAWCGQVLQGQAWRKQQGPLHWGEIAEKIES